MRAKPEFRDRDDTEVAVLDALADRRDEGMTVFELRSEVDVEHRDFRPLPVAVLLLRLHMCVDATVVIL